MSRRERRKLYSTMTEDYGLTSGKAVSEDAQQSVSTRLLPEDQPGHGISAAEQEDIRGEIERAFRGERDRFSESRFGYTPMRRGVLLPAVLNGAALLVTIAAVLLLYGHFQREERVLAEIATEPSGTVAGLLEQFRADAALELSEREREIERIRTELAQLADRAAGPGVQEASRRRVAELEQRLAEVLEEEQRLAQEAMAVDALAALERVQQQERLLAAQLSGALLRIHELEADLQSLQDQLAASTEPPAPVVSAVERDPERVVVRELPEEEARELTELRARVPELRQLTAELQRERDALQEESNRQRTQLDALQGERDALQNERNTLAGREAQVRTQLSVLQVTVSRLERERETLAQAEQSRRELQGRVTALRRSLEAARATADPDRDEVLRAVESKLAVLEVLTAEPVRSRHPGLDGRLEEYLDTLADDARREGLIAGLREAVALIRRAGTPRTDVISAGRYSVAERAIAVELVQELEQLLH